jgi:hypothetical protein
MSLLIAPLLISAMVAVRLGPFVSAPGANKFSGALGKDPTIFLAVSFNKLAADVTNVPVCCPNPLREKENPAGGLGKFNNGMVTLRH